MDTTNTANQPQPFGSGMKALLNALSFNRIYFWISVYSLLGISLGMFLLRRQKVVDEFGMTMWALAFLLMGAVVGLLFGVPKVITSRDITSDSGGLTTEQRLQANTNLSDISDWLTKLIIGAGLIQLKDLPKYLMRVADKMATGLAVDSRHLPQASLFCAGTVLYAVLLGFFSGYFVTRFVVTDLLRHGNG